MEWLINLFTTTDGGDGAIVFVVHHYDMVETVEVLPSYLSGTMVEAVTMVVTVTSHA